MMEHAPNILPMGTASDGGTRGSNQAGIRDFNERLVLTLIRQGGAMAKAEIARKTGLSAQTVSVIMRALEADGLLQRSAPVRGKIGQPSVPLGLARNGAFFFGLKIGRRSLDLVLIDFLGAVTDRMHVSHRYPTPDGAVRFATEAILQMTERLPAAHRQRIAGLGIALPFQLWEWAGTLGIGADDMAGWRDRDISTEIGERCAFPVFLCNDASAACGAELVFGDRDKPRDFLHVFIGFFVGGGLVLDGTLFTGGTGNAAALGSMSVPTADGEMRQLVEVASLSLLERMLSDRDAADSMDWNAPAQWDLPNDVLDIWLDAAAKGIGHAILSSVCLIDVNHVLVDGWMPEALRAELVDRIRQHVTAHAVPGIQTPSVLEGSIGADARALGAASLPLSHRFLLQRATLSKGPKP